MNQFQLEAQVVEREALRYSPAGIPIVAAKLAHRSQQLEARIERQVELEIAALAIGEVSGAMQQLDLGRVVRFTGFLAKKNRNSRSLVFHIVAIDDHQTTQSIS